MENFKQKNSRYIFFALSIAFLFCFLLLNIPFLRNIFDELSNTFYLLKYGLYTNLFNQLPFLSPFLDFSIGNIISYILPYIFKYSFLYFTLICYLIYIYKSNLSKKLLCLIPTYIFIVLLIIINVTYVTDFIFGNFFIRSLYNLGLTSYRPAVIRSISDFILVYYLLIIRIYNLLSAIYSFIVPFIILLMIICFIINFINLILNLKSKMVFKILLFVLLVLFTYNLLDVLVISKLLFVASNQLVSYLLSFAHPNSPVYFAYQMLYILLELIKIIIILGKASVYISSFIIVVVTFILFVIHVFKNATSKLVKIISLILPIIIMSFGLFIFSINVLINAYGIIISILNLFIVF